MDMAHMFYNVLPAAGTHLLERQKEEFPFYRISRGSSSRKTLPFSCPCHPLLQQRMGAVAFILYFAGLRKKRISEGFEHRSLNSSLELRGFIKDYFKQLPIVGGRGWQVLGR